MNTSRKEVARFFSSDKNCIEIGALACPCLPRAKNVQFVDFLTREELVNLHHDKGSNFIKNIVDVDIVWDGSDDLSTFKGHGLIDLVCGAHLFEHIQNPVGWIESLQSIGSDSQIISLIIPNKNFCFDKYRPLTSYGELISAYLLKTYSPSLKSVIDQRFYAVRAQDKNSWEDNFEPDIFKKVFDNYTDYKHMVERCHSGHYVDSHCTVWTPDYFYDLFSNLKKDGFLNYQALDVIDFGSEFVCHISK